MTKKLVKEKATDTYKMSVYEVPTSWGHIKETVFVRPKNTVGDLRLQTVIREWTAQNGQARSNKRYEVIEKDKVVSVCYANLRWDNEKKEEYLANKSEVSAFFYSFGLHKRLKRLEVSYDLGA